LQETMVAPFEEAGDF